MATAVGTPGPLLQTEVTTWKREMAALMGPTDRDASTTQAGDFGLFKGALRLYNQSDDEPYANRMMPSMAFKTLAQSLSQHAKASAPVAAKALARATWLAGDGSKIGTSCPVPKEIATTATVVFTVVEGAVVFADDNSGWGPYLATAIIAAFGIALTGLVWCQSRATDRLKHRKGEVEVLVPIANQAHLPSAMLQLSETCNKVFLVLHKMEKAFLGLEEMTEADVRDKMHNLNVSVPPAFRGLVTAREMTDAVQSFGQALISKIQATGGRILAAPGAVPDPASQAYAVSIRTARDAAVEPVSSYDAFLQKRSTTASGGPYVGALPNSVLQPPPQHRGPPAVPPPPQHREPPAVQVVVEKV